MVAFMSQIIVDDMHDLVEVTLRNPPAFYVSLILNNEIEHTFFQEQFNDEIVHIVQNRFKNKFH